MRRCHLRIAGKRTSERPIYTRLVANMTPSCVEDDCIWPKELAAHLIRTLFGGGEREAVVGTLYVVSPEEARIAIHRAELLPM